MKYVSQFVEKESAEEEWSIAKSAMKETLKAMCGNGI